MEYRGLTAEEARSRLAADGPNGLPASHKRGILKLLVEIVVEPMFVLLLACGALYLLLGDPQEALMLLGFVFVIIGITFFQQRRSERALDALVDLSSPQALVMRDGQSIRIDSRQVVCDDLVLLAEGDRVPADLRFISVSNLSIDESLLTGESMPVQKETLPDDGVDHSGDLNYRQFFALSGTLVTRGTAVGQVVATGERSALGKIGQSLGGIESLHTPLQMEIRSVVKNVAIVGLGLAVILSLAHWYFLGDGLQGLLAGITLAMAILPEELPVVLTLFLGLGAWRLSRERVLAKSIPAIELLGATTVLCVDKTGTLTENKMVVRKLWSGSLLYDMPRTGEAKLPESAHDVLEFAVLASHRRAFDPMEAAILAAGTRFLSGTEHLHSDWTLVEDYPLSRDMLAMSRVWQSPNQAQRMIAAKGAPEAIIDLCHLDRKQTDQIASEVTSMAEQGLRVLGVARAFFNAEELPESQHDFVFEFLGLVALEDPVRTDVPAAIEECHAAGIRVVMITGDHPATAMAVAKQAGLRVDSPPITGIELSTLSANDLNERIGKSQVFCRVQPDQKLRLVQALKDRGEIVAMTGDGVNDAPALKAAHIGVAMGARGTDVAREAAALVLLNDDFSSLVTAIRYGRRVFSNLRKAMVFVLAVHIPIVGLSMLPVLLGWPMLLMPVHILFLQLIIDPACSIVFEAEPLDADAMKSPPRSPDARLFDVSVLTRGLWQGAGLLLLLLALFGTARELSGSDDMARALTFAVLVVSSLGLIFVNRSWNRAIGAAAAQSNPYFLWMTFASIAVLVIILCVPVVSKLFAFALPSPMLMVVGLSVALVSTLWFEGVKRVLGAKGPSLR
ncbi:MAG: cation-translocating P-type ATPase [Rhodoferax sp.]